MDIRRAIKDRGCIQQGFSWFSLTMRLCVMVNDGAVLCVHSEAFLKRVGGIPDIRLRELTLLSGADILVYHTVLFSYSVRIVFYQKLLQFLDFILYMQ